MSQIVIVTGTRRRCDPEPIVRAIRALPADAIVLHGEQTGVDTIANDAALRRGLKILKAPYIGQHGNAGGPERNQLMLTTALALREYLHWPASVLAFPAPDSQGTWNMVNLAKRAGLAVYVVAVLPHAAERERR